MTARLDRAARCVSRIPEKLELPLGMISHHLCVSVKAGPLRRERASREARWIYYKEHLAADRVGLRVQARLYANNLRASAVRQ